MSRRILANKNTAGLTPLQQAIVSAWNFEDQVNDRVGGNDGTATSLAYSDATYQAIGKYGVFSTSEVEIPDDDSLSFGSSPFSISFWIRFNSLSNQYIITKRNTTTGDIEYLLGLFTGDLWWRQYDGSVSNMIGQRIEWNTTNVPTTYFVNIVITHDGGNSQEGISIYQDGALQTTTGLTGGSYSGMDNTDAKLWVGVNADAGNGNFLGNLDELYIFNKELDATEAQFIYDEGVAGRTLI